LQETDLWQDGPGDEGKQTKERLQENCGGNEVSKGSCVFISELTEHGLNQTELLIYKVFLLYYLFYYNGGCAL
jgi:hypothetical protein